MTDQAPIPMLLWCPMCHARHIDEGEFATRSHHSHSCQSCGLTWRPALVPTVGVQFLPGFKNGAQEAYKTDDKLRITKRYLDDLQDSEVAITEISDMFEIDGTGEGRTHEEYVAETVRAVRDLIKQSKASDNAASTILLAFPKCSRATCDKRARFLPLGMSAGFCIEHWREHKQGEEARTGNTVHGNDAEWLKALQLCEVFAGVKDG